MNSEILFVIEEVSDGGYIAKALGESIFTEADSLEHLKVRIKEAVFCHFDEGKGPRMIRLHFVHDEILKL